MRKIMRCAFAFLLCLLLAGCTAAPSETTPEPQLKEPSPQVQPVAEPSSAESDKAELLDPFDGLVEGAELSVKKGSIGDEIHIATTLATDEPPENWNEICDGVLIALQSVSNDPKTAAIIEASDGTILLTVFNGKIQRNAFSGEAQYKSIEMILAEATVGERNAYKSAQSYLSFAAFSYSGLVKQLEYEKYTHSEAVFAADNCGADWYEQAAKCAEQYLKFSSFSRDGLIDQLMYEGFTQAEAMYGASENGY